MTVSQNEQRLLQANGNLQKIILEIINQPIELQVDSQKISRHAECTQFDREISVYVNETRALLYRAQSTVHAYDEQVCQLLETGAMNLGQIFASVEKCANPDFKLLEYGRKDHQSLWRSYSLSKLPFIECKIAEHYEPILLNLINKEY